MQCQSLGTPLCWMPGDSVFRLLQGVGTLGYVVSRKQRNWAMHEGKGTHTNMLTLPPPCRPLPVTEPAPPEGVRSQGLLV